MNSSTNTILAAAAGAVGGLAIGLYLGSGRGTKLRARLGDRIRHGSSTLDRQLANVEQQLHDLEQMVLDARQNFARRLGLTGPEQGTRSDVSSGWGLSQGEVVKELPHLPRR